MNAQVVPKAALTRLQPNKTLFQRHRADDGAFAIEQALHTRFDTDDHKI